MYSNSWSKRKTNKRKKQNIFGTLRFHLQAYNHLGIALNNKTKLGDQIATACNKGWKSFDGLADISITNVNPLAMSHLYKTVVRPSVLYGCELWNAIPQEDVRCLNTLLHGICKVILNLPKQTRSDMCEQLLNLTQIMTEIEAKKLLFFGKLCIIDPRCPTWQTLILRLFSFLSTRLYFRHFKYSPKVSYNTSFSWLAP